MISVTAKEFTANIHEFLDNVDNQDIQIVREGKKPIILTVPKEEAKQDKKISWAEKYSGIISMPGDFDEKEFEMNRLWKKYEGLD